MNCRVFIAETDEDYDFAKGITLEYAKYLNVDLSFQSFDKELESFNEMYGFPKGCVVLVEYTGKIVGAVGLRFLSSGISEMKRMFVFPKFQGLGLGNALMTKLIEQAKVLGYGSIKLDTIPELDKAIGLYEKYNFLIIEPYCYNPHPETLFYYELKIS
jgi:ribosomal protein S18 acetylase RimI-like enzyme